MYLKGNTLFIIQINCSKYEEQSPCMLILGNNCNAADFLNSDGFIPLKRELKTMLKIIKFVIPCFD